ncbi:MAG: CHAT domain-containing protein, partial [Muribaculaceae bacterium]|nr:CHAT domain-containing protein [Muribaculaceae bacterium]
IVMSLWKVNDEATKDMMTSFYTHLMEMGMEHKREAFMKAQQEVRDNDSKYSYDDDDDDNITLDQKQRKTRPHWAAFIMLDGI